MWTACDLSPRGNDIPACAYRDCNLQPPVHYNDMRKEALDDPISWTSPWARPGSSRTLVVIRSRLRSTACSILSVMLVWQEQYGKNRHQAMTAE